MDKEPQIFPQQNPEANPAEALAELLRENQQEFFTQLNTLQQEIIARDMKLKRQAGELNPFYPPEAQVQIPGMCGYSAPAITEALRTVLGKENVRTVYGHNIKGATEDPDAGYVVGRNGYARPPYHYWTQVKVNGEGFFIDATYGQFDPKYKGKIIFAPIEDLGKYGLLEYNIGDRGGTKMDEKTVRALQKNNGNLPVDLNDELKYLYDRLVESISIPAQHKLTPDT